MQLDVLVEELIAEFDKNLLLGAAWDCLSEDAKKRFRERMVMQVKGFLERKDVES